MKTILRILCRSFFVYLAIGGSIEGLTGVSSWLDSGGSEDPDGPLEVRSWQGRPQPQIKVILVVGVERSGVDLKQCYPNGLADPLSVEQLEL